MRWCECKKFCARRKRKKRAPSGKNKKRHTHRRRSSRVATFGSRWVGNAAGSRFPFFFPNNNNTRHGMFRKRRKRFRTSHQPKIYTAHTHCYKYYPCERMDMIELRTSVYLSVRHCRPLSCHFLLLELHLDQHILRFIMDAGSCEPFTRTPYNFFVSS